MSSRVSQLFLISLLVGAFGIHSWAMDIQEYDMLIQKLELVKSEVRGQATESDFIIRLGDLYSDRARLKFNTEIENGCENCQASKADRLQAIQHYNSALRIQPKNQTARITTQLVYLYTMSGQTRDARKLLNKVIGNPQKYTPEAVGQAYVSLGELEYQIGKFKSALNYYKKSQKFPVQNREFVIYRMAWSEMNSNQLGAGKQRMIGLLKSPSIQGQPFQLDVARDLVTFVARGHVDNKSIKELLAVTPEDQRKSNLFLLGQECDRIGNKKGSLLVWREYASLPSADQQDKLEVHIRTAQTLLDQGDKTQALGEYKVSDVIARQSSCEKSTASECEDYNQRSRSLIYNWIKKEKSKPSIELLGALEIYTATYAEDLEMINWTANISRFHKLNEKAAKYYGLAADQSKSGLDSNKFYHSTMNTDFANKILISATNSEIVCAEATGSDVVMKKAYLHYLKVMADGPKSDEVRYQLTYLEYKQGHFEVAAKDFESLAKGSNKLNSSMKIQAANLALKAYEASENETLVSQKAVEFSKAFPGQSSVYFDVARKSIHKQATSLNQKNKSKEAYALLVGIPLAGASTTEKAQILKDKISLAERLHDLTGVETAADQLLNISKLNRNDQDFAFEKKLWVAESRLDFKNALNIVKTHPPRSLSPEQQSLKTAVLSELSGNSARPHYEMYIKRTSSVQKANLIRAKFVRESSRPWVELANQKSRLRLTPEIYASAVADAYNRQPNDKVVASYLRDRKIRKNSALTLIVKKSKLAAIQDLERSLSQARLNERTSSSLKKSLNKKLELLNRVGQELRLGIQSGDFTIQVVSSDILIRENRRLANEIEKLTPPKSLKGEKRKHYVGLLKKQAEPYLVDAEKLAKQVDQLWAKSKYPRELIQLLESTPGQLDRTIEEELKTISRYSSRSRSNSISKQIELAQKKISSRDVVKAKVEVQKDPFDSEKLSRLLDLEKRRGSETMVAFLEARLSVLKAENL